MASNEPVRVEQCDWIAAETWWTESDQLCHASITRLAEAFARHRTLSQADGWREALTNAARRVVEVARYWSMNGISFDQSEAIQELATALAEVHQEKNDGRD